jgi:two-component system phosphate regulon response regulator PhoB
MAVHRILIVEDDRSLADVVSYNLEQQGYEVHVARDGMEGLNHARLNPPDLVVLDLMLPVIDGLEVCRRLRADSNTRDLSILMLTAKSEETDEVVGFSVGADDYVTKPFSIKVLLQRVKALLRRADHQQQDGGDVVASQGIVIDRRRHVATVDGLPVSLTRTEFGLLETLVRQPGRAFSRAELIQAAIGDDAYVMDRTVDVHVRAVRSKLGDHARLIETVRGVGYRLHEGKA